MITETKTLKLTDDEVTLLFWMAGYSSNNIPKIYSEAYDNFMKKLTEAEG